jgi:hypothetical protein
MRFLLMIARGAFFNGRRKAIRIIPQHRNERERSLESQFFTANSAPLFTLAELSRRTAASSENDKHKSVTAAHPIWLAQRKRDVIPSGRNGKQPLPLRLDNHFPANIRSGKQLFPLHSLMDLI